LALVNVDLTGSLANGQEYKLGPFPAAVTITAFSPHVLVAPVSTALVVRVQSATGASPANFIQASIAAGSNVLASSATGSFTLAAGSPLFIRVVTASSAEFLGGFVEIDGPSTSAGGLRTRRNWTAMLAEIRRILRETTAATSYWTDQDLLDMFNRSMDLRVMDLADAHEGWVTSQVSQNIVADQNIYNLPEGTGRVKRVVYCPDIGSNSSIEIPLSRNERWGETLAQTTQSSGGIFGGTPSYRILGNKLHLEPAPSKAATNGLKLEIEHAPDRIAVGTDVLSPYFPDIMETLLIYDTAVEAMEVEAGMGNLSAETYFNSMARKRDRYERSFRDYITVRSFGPIYGTAWTLGD